MKTVRIHPKYALIDIKGLVLIYLLLSIITILFWRTVFPEILQGGTAPNFLDLGVFFTIPAVLVVFLGASLGSLFRELITRQMGSRFHIRLLAYFILIVIFASLPSIIISSQTALELSRFWKTIQVDDAMKAAQDFALETYSLHLAQAERLITTLEPDALEDASTTLPPEWSRQGLRGIADFARAPDGTWKPERFRGDSAGKLMALPAQEPGFVPRELPRDTDYVRYVVYPRPGVARVFSYHLGAGFDKAVTTIENEKERFDLINSLQIQLRPLLVFYFVVFFFPIMLMTLIIAISFTQRFTQPMVELTEATRRVAEGDFSIHILARRKDELGLLIRSFNTMVQDLKRSHASQVKAEKISLWQRMAEQLAHEIKNPLTPIKLSAERVLRRYRHDPQRLGEILEPAMLSILQEVEGLSALLTEFRTFSRPMEPSRTASLLREVVEEILSSYRAAEPEVCFDSTHTAWDIQVAMDRRRLSQVLTNLINNSLDAMDHAGTVEIRTDLVKKWESRYCRVSIMDTGKGMSPEEGSQIFTPYFTTKETGTGLGLPIVERIVQDHGGSIWFNSAESLGTTFFVDIPVAPPKAETPTEPERESL
ncbi:MAG: HAMP domain-containing protein [Spirochaetaceae bacterium]|jgi:nitrogen fixation/metabolism regulation signal transduction histidine kinase|nr:HAMP domain-containing protein [Spirochaetaceae bacterium]